MQHEMSDSFPASGDWKSEGFRRKVVQQIDDALRAAGNPGNKSSPEMENHVFQRSKSRDDYLALVARLIIHVREINSKKEKQQQQQMAPNMLGGPQGMQDPLNALQNPLNALQSMSKAGMPPGLQGQQLQGPPQGMMGGMPAGNQMVRPGMVGMNQQMRQPQPQQQMMAQNMGGQPMGVQNIGGQSMGGMQAMQRGQPALSPYGQTSQATPSSLSSVLSPPQVGMVPSPSPGNAMPIPSPGSRQSNTAPSPGGGLNTPGNPNSMGASASPAARTAEDIAYAEKHKQLSRYIEPLRRMISRIDKDENRKKELSKMKRLLDVLSDTKTRSVPMSTLLKCENVLEKLELQVQKSTAATTPGTTTPTTTALGVTAAATTAVTTAAEAPKPVTHICQPLLDAVAAHARSPMLNHTLYRTFSPAIQALHGPPIRCPSPPPKKQKIEQDRENNFVPNVLQGEIARLDYRFRVNLHPLCQAGCKDIQLICKLEDKDLPSVPPLNVTVPAGYPKVSPICDTKHKDYDMTEFLKNVMNNLTARLVRLAEIHSLSTLLDTWEMSVRVACNNKD
ncbi:unnamed protein product [Owenia fusiformis]|uniref:Mediator of RNA polymerase II transcription subunit 15 n=1 Tax=Owenia fusiformis TaxID=6347 RepID=A0A8J1TKA0_OWEFU|nr:unnamed protein product [Owenia fusiformis]